MPVGNLKFVRRLILDPEGENAALGKLLAEHRKLHLVAQACEVANNTVRSALVCRGWIAFHTTHAEWLLKNNDGSFLRPRFQGGVFSWERVDPATLPVIEAAS